MIGTLKKVFNTDAWANIISGLGTSRDKRIATTATWAPLPEVDAQDLYDGSDVARKICEDLPEEALREGFEIKFEGTNKELNKAIVDELDRLGFNQKLIEASIWARVFGGAAIIPMTEDLLSLSKPFNPNGIRRISNFLVLNAFELVFSELDEDIRSPNFGYPLFYTICPRGGATTQSLRVHYSHLIRFDGARLTRQNFQKNKYWNDSVLNSSKQAIADYESSMASLANALQDFSVAVYKQKGLHDQIAEGDDETVIKRMRIISLTRSIARAVVIDSDTEEFTYQNRTMSGVHESAQKISQRLVVASNMPHTRILGESPDGSNATGNSTTSQWYDYVAAWQKNYLTPRMIKLFDRIALQKEGPLKGTIPQGYTFEFAPLWQLSQDEEATARKTQADADAVYIQNGVFTPEHIAKSRVGSGKYSFETLPLEDETANG